MGDETYWRRQNAAATVALHVLLNTAVPVALFGLVTLLSGDGRPFAFALASIAPWTAVASAAIALVWIARGRAGRHPAPPRVWPDIVVGAAGWAALFGVASLGWASLRDHALVAPAFLDGAVSAFVAALMSGIAFARMMRRAASGSPA